MSASPPSVRALPARRQRARPRQHAHALLDREQSPLVQIAMINFVAASGDRGDAAPTRWRNSSAMRSDHDKAVREAANRALAQL